MIAGVEGVVGLALEIGHAVGQDRRARAPGLGLDAGEAVDILAHELTRQGLMLGVQHIDRPASGRVQSRQASRLEVDTDQRQRRVEGHRGEGIGRQPDLASILAHGGDHRHPGREATKRVAQSPGVVIAALP
jgi:hypothetical protein